MNLILGDCLEKMKEIPNGSIDMILCDLPYGVTQNPWDSVIPLEELWTEYNRIIKENGAVVLFGQDKFTAKVMLSNEKFHRYNLIWNKETPTGFLNANRMPMRIHEDIMVFYKKAPLYNPQKYVGEKPSHRRCKKSEIEGHEVKINNNYNTYSVNDKNTECLTTNLKFPNSILTFKRVPTSKCLHPTQKPVELLEWLIKTYTNEGEIVLDNCMGSGSTGVACKNLNREFIGIEKDEKYFNIAKERIENV